jgi:hypothetical protein
MGKKKQKKGRPQIVDIAAVRKYAGAEDLANKGPQYVISRSYSEVVDLISEGPIEGIASGKYSYKYDSSNTTGWKQVNFDVYTATGTDASNTAMSQGLGFLRSVYWNEIPLVDKDGYYNFPSININYVKGNPTGDVPKLGADLPGYGDLSSSEQLDLSITRAVGERLYGPEVKGGDASPTSTRQASLKGDIDKYAKTYTILNKECSAIQVNIKVSALFENIMAGPKTYKKSKYLRACAKASTGYGDTKARTVEYSIYYQPIFDDRFGNQTQTNLNKSGLSAYKWTLAKKETITGKIDEPYIRTTNIDITDAGFMDKEGFEGWRIRIVRTTPESLTSFLRNQTFVDSLVEVYGTKLSYPYSGMVYSLFDARSFQRMPHRAYDTKLLKVKVPNNYNPILKSYGKSDGSGSTKENCTLTEEDSGASNYKITKWTRSSVNPEDSVWDGEFKKDANGEFLKEWTDNPAWCFYDLLTNPRYGLGEYIDSSNVDKWALYEIAQYCDELVDDTYGGFEPRFTINYIITSREEAFKVLNDLASIFRGIAYYANGSIFSAQDKFKAPVYQFNNSNVLEGNFTYSSSAKKARHTVAIVRYNDKRNSFQPAIEYVENEEAVRRYGIREIQTTALGCTSRGQARRFAKWILASESEETETVSFTAGLEGSYLRPGDVIQIYDNNISPLKYSGRTNIVRPLTINKSRALNYDFEDSNNVNSIVLDQSLNFEADKIYELSLLTPTYDYSSSSANSSQEQDGVRRSHIQKLYFNGSDTNVLYGTNGAYRSDTIITGAPVCTQIFFNSGLGIQNDGTVGVLDNTYSNQTGNQLDFRNYVITGYTNNNVSPNSPGEGSISVDYSGGCFSGENLIWSVEPADKNDPDYIDGNYLNYKVINAKEEANATHSIAALLYSSGKYDQVDSVNTAFSDVASASGFFPVLDVVGFVNADVDTWVENYPEQTYLPDASSDGIKSNKNLLEVAEDYPYIGTRGENRDMLSMLIDFSTAKLRGNFNLSSSETKTISSTDNKTETDQNILNYSVSIITSGDPLITKNWINGNPTTPVDSVTYIVDAEHYETVRSNEVALITKDDKKYFLDDFSRIKLETLVSEKVAHYVVVYPITDAGTVGHGLLNKFNVPNLAQIDNYIVNPVGTKLITSLKTEGIGGNPANSGVITTESEEPTFVWNVSDPEGIYNEDPDITETEGNITIGNTKAYEMFYLNDLLNYRVTIRENSTKVSPNIPSDTIYYEFTGYSSPTSSPSFVFDYLYNTPNVINDIQPTTSLTYTGSNENARGYSRYENAGPNNNEIFYKVDPSGFVVKDYPKFPLRNFDIVVEVQGADGVTSCNNPLYANTIGGYFTAQGTSLELFNDGANIDANYDIMSISIDSPSGLFFAQQHDKDNPSNPNRITYLSDRKASINEYPYMAQASIYPNGYLYLSINQVEKTNGELTINEEQFDNYFNNTVGLVYYYTTGDNSVDYEGDTLVSLNASPDFRVEIDNRVGEVFSADTDANIDSLRASAVNSDGTAFAGIVKGLPSDYNGLVHRGYYLFGDDVDLETIQIPFPHVGRRDVQNIRVAMAFFDNLSLKRAFDDTDDATPIYVESSSGKRLAKIFTDTDLNFSTKVTDLETKYSVEALERTEEEDGKKPFVEQPGTAIFLSEDSVLSSHDAALAFRGWAEVVIGATAKQAEILRTDTKLLHTLSLLSDVPINGPYAQMEINKESYETGDPIEGLPNGNTYKTPINPSFKKGVIDLSSVEVYCAAYGDPAAIGKDGGDREADRRVIRLVVPFEGVTYDIDKYSVLCDVYEGDTWNWGAAGNEPPGRPKFRFMTDSTRYWVSKEESQFTIDISQEGAPYPLGTELMAQRNFPQVVDFIKGGAMKINIRVLATDE